MGSLGSLGPLIVHQSSIIRDPFITGDFINGGDPLKGKRLLVLYRVGPVLHATPVHVVNQIKSLITLILLFIFILFCSLFCNRIYLAVII